MTYESNPSFVRAVLVYGRKIGTMIHAVLGGSLPTYPKDYLPFTLSPATDRPATRRRIKG